MIAHVFKHGLGKSGGGGGRSMEDFAKPLRVFSPDGAIDKKLHCELPPDLQPARGYA